jgi:hypothetical protein
MDLRISLPPVPPCCQAFQTSWPSWPVDYASRRGEADFATHPIVVHVRHAASREGKLTGVQFTGPRLRPVVRLESAA